MRTKFVDAAQQADKFFVIRAISTADYTHLGCVLELEFFFFLFSQTFVVSINLEKEKLFEFKGGESSSQFRQFTIAKIEL